MCPGSVPRTQKGPPPRHVYSMNGFTNEWGEKQNAKTADIHNDVLRPKILMYLPNLPGGSCAFCTR